MRSLDSDPARSTRLARTLRRTPSWALGTEGGVHGRGEGREGGCGDEKGVWGGVGGVCAQDAVSAAAVGLLKCAWMRWACLGTCWSISRDYDSGHEGISPFFLLFFSY